MAWWDSDGRSIRIETLYQTRLWYSSHPDVLVMVDVIVNTVSYYYEEMWYDYVDEVFELNLLSLCF